MKEGRRRRRKEGRGNEGGTEGGEKRKEVIGKHDDKDESFSEKRNEGEAE